MQTIKKLIADKLVEGICALGAPQAPEASELMGMLEYPPDDTMGDLALPCFKLSRTLRRAPVQIAAALAECLGNMPSVEKAEAVNGYLNITVSKDYLVNTVLGGIIEAGEAYGSSEVGKGKTVVLDYSSPNVAKPFHIGHLGTTVIGHSLKKLHEFHGYKCVGINYLGDWGTQFGKLIVAYKKWGNKEMIEQGGIDKLVELYVKINNAISGNAEQGIVADPALGDAARAEFKKLEMGDEDNLALWRWFIDISLAEYEKTYKQLGITFDSYKGESFYTDKMPAEVGKLRDKGLLKIDDGASIVDLEPYGMPPCLILKRDGSTLYPTRDIAAAVYRKNTYDYDKSIYVTSAGQSLHFAQWFKVVELMGYDWHDKLVHVPYGTVSINGAKLATRTGNVVLLKDLFRAAIEEVSNIMTEKNPNIENKEEIAEAVGVGAIVFYYLSNSRIKDINFVMEDALNFDGNTGPYAQYTYARTCAVLRRAEGEVAPASLSITSPDEAALLKVLAKFPEKVSAAIEDYEPSVITRYILDVAAAFNRFYHNCQILSAQDPNVRATRVAITRATNVVLGNAFPLVCMKKMEKI
ncbi:MAG: arginine--tRNA ligase [Clostridia bacterium]|nr:arginine--tRNA ligase [Clostridia bacterium]